MKTAPFARLLAVFALLVMTIVVCGVGMAAHQTAAAQSGETPIAPPVRREFRGVWVASVANIDWPSKPGLSTEQQKAELIALLDRARHLNLNAIVLQVRPACDALYASPFEPWSEYLTGQMGRKPEPYYDPLEFAVTEAHRRGLELHAWFNPYRARHAAATGPVSDDHISRKRPDLVRTYGRSLWLDPGEPDVREHSLRVITDVVHRYDIDGVHIDDYFYPYKERGADGKIIDFPDEASYGKYVAGGGKLAKDDWRRENVNQFIQALYQQVKAEKPWVKVGISPFGIGRPGSPAQIAGFDQYSELYADAKKWWNEGWCDYLAPQLYWKVEQTAQAYPVLLSWWASENTKGRHLWPGQFTSRVDDAGKSAWPAQEIEYQIRATRGQKSATGTIHFSAKALTSDEPGKVGPLLRETVYAEPALIPPSPWLAPPGSDKPLPAPVGLTVSSGNGDFLPPIARWKAADAATGRSVWQWVVQARGSGEQWTTILVPAVAAGAAPACALPPGTDRVSVFAIDRYGAATGAVVAAAPLVP